MKPLEFERDADRVLAYSDSSGIWINAIWTVGIPKAAAIEYAKTFDSSPAKGFCRDDNGQVVLSHGSGKIILSEEEAAAIVALIEESFQ